MTDQERRQILRREMYDRIETQITRKEKEEDMQFMLVLVELITDYAREKGMSINKTLDTIAHNLKILENMADFDADEEGA